MGDDKAAALPVAMVVVDGKVELSAVSGPSVPAAVDPLALGAPPSPHAAGFAVARRDPDFATAMATRVAGPAVGITQLGPIAMLICGLVLLRQVAGDVFGTLFVLGWCGLVGWFIWRAWRPIVATTEVRLARVLARTTQVRTIADHDPHGRALHHARRTVFEQRVTLELEDGRRVALGGDEAILGTVMEGDIGAAYSRVDQLIGFRRLGA